MILEPDGNSIARRGALAILSAFEAYHNEFKQITRRARQRFESRDWQGGQRDAVERLELYGRVISQIVLEVREILGETNKDAQIWERMKVLYSSFIAGKEDFDLAETFFNSVTRRIFSTVGVATNIELSLGF
jgi:isocitrate dehydrogenase kinase/phosphatase